MADPVTWKQMVCPYLNDIAWPVRPAGESMAQYPTESAYPTTKLDQDYSFIPHIFMKKTVSKSPTKLLTDVASCFRDWRESRYPQGDCSRFALFAWIFP